MKKIAAMAGVMIFVAALAGCGVSQQSQTSPTLDNPASINASVSDTSTTELVGSTYIDLPPFTNPTQGDKVSYNTSLRVQLDECQAYTSFLTLALLTGDGKIVEQNPEILLERAGVLRIDELKIPARLTSESLQWQIKVSRDASYAYLPYCVPQLRSKMSNTSNSLDANGTLSLDHNDTKSVGQERSHLRYREMQFPTLSGSGVHRNSRASYSSELDLRVSGNRQCKAETNPEVYLIAKSRNMVMEVPYQEITKDGVSASIQIGTHRVSKPPAVTWSIRFDNLKPPGCTYKVTSSVSNAISDFS